MHLEGKVKIFFPKNVIENILNKSLLDLTFLQLQLWMKYKNKGEEKAESTGRVGGKKDRF